MSVKIIQNSIRKLRFMSSEMTQQELAEKTGVSRQTINATESNVISESTSELNLGT